jgi:hypothetical protein
MALTPEEQEHLPLYESVRLPPYENTSSGSNKNMAKRILDI